MLPFLHRISVIPAHVWQKLIIALAAISIIFTAIGILEKILTKDSLYSITTKSLDTQTTQTSQEDINIDVMAQWHLFGKHDTAIPRTNNVATQNNDNNIGKTRLSIQLLGIMYADDEQHARAILLINEKERQFKVGEVLPINSNVKLNKILTDRVIVSNNGSLEALWLFDPSKPRINTPSTTKADTTQSSERPVIQNNRSISTPNQGYVYRLSPAWASEGKLQGYQINRGSNTNAFDAMGFNDGDVIIQINETQIDTPENAAALYQQLQRGGMNTVTVLRDGQTITFDTEITPNSSSSPSVESEAASNIDGN